MWRFVWSQVRFRRRRAAALGLGVLIAVVSFVLLTSAVETSALEVRGTVAQNWETAYDILVRPPDSFTPLERSEGLVRENYLGGIFGGITRKQYEAVRSLPGVEVAAPIANVGYIAPHAVAPVEIGDLVTEEEVQLYRLRYSWVGERGLSWYPGGTDYVYYTRRNTLVSGNYGPREVVTGHDEPLDVCGAFNARLDAVVPASPFDTSEQARSSLQCFSSRSPEAAGFNLVGMPEGAVGSATSANFPILVAAIDPEQEDRLVGVGDAIVSGRSLRDGEPATLETIGDVEVRTVPVLAASRLYMDQRLQVRVERLQPPSGVDPTSALASEEAFSFLTGLPGREVAVRTYEPGPMYERLLERYATPSPNTNAYWSTSSVDYRVLEDDTLVPRTVRNPESVWENAYVGNPILNTANADVQFRRLRGHPYAGSGIIENDLAPLPGLLVVGRYDPERLPGFNPLTRVPLETYYPPQAQPADDASRAALGGQPLLPTMNLGGYIAQPPLILTTLQAAEVLFDAELFRDANQQAPISVIRVRVDGATGPDPISRERIRQVATAIIDRTGLAVDITAGSSPQPRDVRLPAGAYGRPTLTLEEGWVKKGAAVTILTAVDRKSLALFVLVLVVSSLFLANGAFASARARRSEIGVLRCLGWTPSAIFAAVLGELALVGLASGVLGTALAVILIRWLALDLPLVTAAAVAPLAVLLCVAAGAVPAWRAARAQPLDAVRPAVADPSSTRPVRTVAGMAVANLVRVPARTFLAGTGLCIGVAALTVLLAVNLAFQGTVVGTLLGGLVSVRVRGADYLAVACVMLLAALSVADLLFVNLRERAAEFVTLRAGGWPEFHLGRLVALEGLAVSVAGSLAGMAVGLLVSAVTGGIRAGLLPAAALAGAAGVGVALIASLVPASLTARLTPPAVLADD